MNFILTLVCELLRFVAFLNIILFRCVDRPAVGLRHEDLQNVAFTAFMSFRDTHRLW